MGVSHSSSRSAVRLALVTNPPPAAPGTPTGVPAGLRLLRTLDRAVLEVARDVGLRPMELYAVLLMSGSAEWVTTRRLAELLAASTSQAKQIALRLATAGYAERRGGHGWTRLSGEGRRLGDRATHELERMVADRASQMGADRVADGRQGLSDLFSAAG